MFFDNDYVTAWAAAGLFEGSDEQVAGITELLGLPAGARILGAACGFGHIAGGLHEQGYAVTGVDINLSQIARAEREHPGPRCVVGDMRDLPDGRYEAVVNIFSSFGYFADDAEDLRALPAWYDVLAPGGQLVMTLTHRDRVVALEVSGALEDDERLLREEATTDWVRGLRHVTWRYEAMVKRATLPPLHRPPSWWPCANKAVSCRSPPAAGSTDNRCHQKRTCACTHESLESQRRYQR